MSEPTPGSPRLAVRSPRARGALAWSVAAAGVICTLWGLALVWTGASRLYVVGVRLSSRSPLLVLLTGLAILTADVWFAWPKAARRVVAAALAPSRTEATWIAVAVALATCATTAHFASPIAGGADSYGYVSQAALWRQGTVVRAGGDAVAETPWPYAINTWTPLGYRPVQDRVVPIYPPGLPLVMAAFQSIAGYCGAFYVAPIAAAAVVLLTFCLALVLFDRPAAGVWAALLVASSPVFLYMAVQPMSDVPATAAWTLVFVLVAANRPIAAGLAIGIALAIRPNLFAVAGAVVFWCAVVDWRRWRDERRLSLSAARVAAAAVPAISAIAWWNWHAYESVGEVGYGSVESLYSSSHLATNIAQFGQWTLETQPPIFLVAALFFAVPAIARGARVPFARLLLGGALVAVFASYAFYVPFDAWWFLRFLLPLWPAMMVAAARAIDIPVIRWPSAFTRAGAILVVAASTAMGVATADDRHAFDVWRNERRYVDVARYLEAHTDPRAVVITFQHSGSIRNYGGRLTLRWDLLDEAWLDRAVAFLVSIGRHPYIVLDGAEVEAFRTRFARGNRIGALDWRPMAALRTPPVAVYDPLNQHAPTTAIIPGTADDRAQWRCDLPATSSLFEAQRLRK